MWVHAGGAMAITAETEGEYLLEHNMNMQAWGKAPRSKRGKKPEMRPYPKPLYEADQKRQYLLKNAEAWRRKYGRPE